ncbi:MAG TPA: hypothetical protein GXZ23_02130 [Clostridiales bacterium]|nr:hypothetical protein [Clostridiales bacterium]
MSTKKILAFIISAVILFAALSTLSIAANPAFARGDVNRDGKIKPTDARLALQAALGLVEIDEEQILLADMNGDGKVKTTDAVTILRIALSMVPAEDYTWPAETPTEAQTIPVTEEPTEVFTTEALTTEAPTEQPTEKPTEGGVKDGKLKYYEKYYVKGKMVSSDGSENDVCFAVDGKDYFARSNVNGKDVGFIIDKVPLGRELYMIDYTADEYLYMSSSTVGFFKTIAGKDFDMDAMIDSATGDMNLTIPYIDSYENMAFDEYVTVDGENYGVVITTNKEGIVTKYYFKEGDTDVALIESLSVDKTKTEKIIIEEVSGDPSPYFKPPKDMKKVELKLSLGSIMNPEGLNDALAFMERFAT